MISEDNLQDEMGNNHIATNENTPLRADAFELSDEQKIESIKIYWRQWLKYFATIMEKK